jgi:hypothetical protein
LVLAYQTTYRIKHPLPRDSVPQAAADLNLLWADFRVTGEYTPVSRILDTLDRPGPRDLREKLSALLKKKDLPERDNFLQLVGWLKLIQPGTKDKLIDGDLEMVMLRDAKGRVRENSLEIAVTLLKDHLRFPLEELERELTLKGEAIESMQSQLEQSPRLAEVLNSITESGRPGVRI